MPQEYSETSTFWTIHEGSLLEAETMRDGSRDVRRVTERAVEAEECRVDGAARTRLRRLLSVRSVGRDKVGNDCILAVAV